jgi:hypothetical protein
MMRKHEDVLGRMIVEHAHSRKREPMDGSVIKRV